MTIDSTGPESAAEPTKPATVGDDTTEPEQDQGEPDGRDTRFRRRLREAAEATAVVTGERDQLRAQVERMQRGEVTRLAAEQQLAKPDAIWAGGLVLADVLGDDGTVDADKARTAIAAAVADLGLAIRPRQPRRDAAQGARPNDHDTSANPWADLLHKR